jgi:hypothetical protein
VLGDQSSLYAVVPRRRDVLACLRSAVKPNAGHFMNTAGIIFLGMILYGKLKYGRQ